MLIPSPTATCFPALPHVRTGPPAYARTRELAGTPTVVVYPAPHRLVLRRIPAAAATGAENKSIVPITTASLISSPRHQFLLTL